MRIDWKSLKKFLDDTKLYRFLNYIELDSSYYTWIFYEGETFSSILQKGSVECQIFENEYKKLAVLKNDLTDDGIKFSRTMFVGRQRMMHCLFSTITTSTMQTNDETGFISIKLRNSLGEITQISEEAVFTELDFCPGENVSYGLYGGSLESIDDLETEFIVNAILAPEIPRTFGGSLYFIRNRTLRIPKESLTRCAINVGDISGEVLGVNVLRIQIKHDAGLKKKFQAEIQYYL